jgi:hypothetical protein
VPIDPYKEGDMQYILLIYGDEDARAAMSDEERAQGFAAYGAFTQELRDKGAMVAGDPLQPSTATTVVRVRDGEQLTTDGPFAETKEQLGGYYLIDVDTLDEAIEWASKIPGARTGAIEVRPLMAVPAEAQA